MSLSKSFSIRDEDLELDEFEQDDYMLALKLEMQLNSTSPFDAYSSQKVSPSATYSSSSSSSIPRSLTDPEWELIDPCPDIRAMFQEFDKLYFWNRLGSCIVEWSKRMTICAGIFYLREGGIIRLSEPLLKFRPRINLIETLLHEMIHAYLYLTRNFKDRGEHGDEFKSHMNRINKLASTNITVYHSFHDEVNHARQHVWRCNGPCKNMPPFHGYVKRSMNRAPGKNDTWWAEHQRKCNGTFEKISEPESFKAKQNSKLEKTSIKKPESIFSSLTSSQNTNNSKKKALLNDTSNIKKIDSYFSQNSTQQTSSSSYSSSNFLSQDYFASKKRASDGIETSSTPVSSKKISSDIIVLDDDEHDKKTPIIKLIKKETHNVVVDLTGFSNTEEKNNFGLVECPLCFQKFKSSIIDVHVNNHFN
jgi:predicted SprT family Zn-dependent metalloprotease